MPEDHAVFDLDIALSSRQFEQAPKGQDREIAELENEVDLHWISSIPCLLSFILDLCISIASWTSESIAAQRHWSNRESG